MMRWNVIERSEDGAPRTEVAQVPGGLLFRTCAWMNSPSAAVSIGTALEFVPVADGAEAHAFVQVMSASIPPKPAPTLTPESVATARRIIAEQTSNDPVVDTIREVLHRKPARKKARKSMKAYAVKSKR